MSNDEAQAFLDELAASKGATYASIGLHNRPNGTRFYAAGLHRGDFVQTEHGDTLDEAVTKLAARHDWFDASERSEAA